MNAWYVLSKSLVLTLYYEEKDLEYCLGGCLYHLHRIVELYARYTKLFEELNPPGTALSGTTSDPCLSHEFDSFLGCSRRVYESIRSVLWKHYGPKEGGRWRSFRSVLEQPYQVPNHYLDLLKNSWNRYGVPLTAYRDSVAHYSPVTQQASPCWMDWYQGRWGLTFKLPSNPGANSRYKYEYEDGPDMLDFCHEAICNLVEITEALGRLDRVNAYLAHPEMGKEWKRMIAERDRKGSRSS